MMTNTALEANASSSGKNGMILTICVSVELMGTYERASEGPIPTYLSGAGKVEIEKSLFEIGRPHLFNILLNSISLHFAADRK